MKIRVTWREKSRGGGLFSGSYVTPEMITFWFHISRTRIGERVFYLNLITLAGGKLKTKRILEVPTNVSAAGLARESAKFIRKFVKENKGIYNEYN